MYGVVSESEEMTLPEGPPVTVCTLLPATVNWCPLM